MPGHILLWRLGMELLGILIALLGAGVMTVVGYFLARGSG